MTATRLQFPVASASPLRLPEELPIPGILVGWSLEGRHSERAIGFNFGDPFKSPATGYIDPIQLEKEGHLITIAPTGAGKGVGCIIPALLRHEGPVIVIDPKGENAAITARRRREMGQEVFVLDPIGITDFESATLNPLDIIDIESPSAVDDAAAIAHGLWVDSPDSRDRFWVSRAQHLLTGLILHLFADRPPPMHNLAALRMLLLPAVSKPGELAAAMMSSRHPEVHLIASALGISAAETLGGILAFTQEMTDFLRGPLVNRATSSSSFPIDRVIRGDPISIYLVLPPHMLESHGRLLRLWVSTLIAAITRRQRQPEKSTLFILDEAAQLGSLPQLRQAVTLLRGYGLQTWSFWQDVSQLQLLYPTTWRTMINNSRVLQCFGALNTNAAADMAALTGFGRPETVIDLAQNEMILQLAGDEAVIARLPNYLNDPPFKGMFDKNPYYDTSRDIMPRVLMGIRQYERATKSLLPPDGFVEDKSGPSSGALERLHKRLLEMWESDTIRT